MTPVQAIAVLISEDVNGARRMASMTIWILLLVDEMALGTGISTYLRPQGGCFVHSN